MSGAARAPDRRHRAEGVAAAAGGLVLLVLGLPLLVLPLAAPAAGAALVLGGSLGRRRAAGPVPRGLASGAVAAGAVLLVLGLLVAAAYATGRGAGVESG